MTFMGLCLLDIFFILLCCYFAVRGAFRGFSGEVILLIGFFAAFYVSLHFADSFGAVLGGLLGTNPGPSRIIAITVLWIAVFLLAAFLRRLMRGLLSAVSLGGIDRFFGIVAGVIKAVIVVYLVLIAGFLAEPVLSPEWMGKSDVLIHAGRHWPKVRGYLTDFGALPEECTLPDGTLEQELRRYRRGLGDPRGNVRHVGENGYL
jgi:uncharacterized membrane protein required for colicin V production